MRGEIIAVGTELLLGQITNTNARFLSEQLAKIGIDVYYHTVVGDNRNRLQQVVRQAASRSDLIVLCGGLGPTDDDLTREVVSDVISVPLALHEPTLARIQSFFNRLKRPMTDNNRKQAMVFAGGTVFPNDNGTAPGLAISTGDRHYILLPGPPRELTPMFHEQVRPYLQKLLPQDAVVHSRVLHFMGIGESLLETKISDLIERQSNPTVAPLAKEGEVTLRLTAKAATAKQAEALIRSVEIPIRERIGQYLYGVDVPSLAHIVVSRLTETKQTVAVAESCTGGFLSSLFTSVPGSSAVFKSGVVCYSAESKEQLLGVPAAVIDKYGTVSEEVARLLAENVREQARSDYGIGVTGVAGPEAVEGKPVGRVYVALARKVRPTVAKTLNLAGLRETIQRLAAKQAMFLLFEALKGQT